MQRMSNQVKNMRAMLLMLFAALSLSVSAQTVTITGNVKDTTGEPIIGASVVEKGNTTNGTITDLDGNFSLKAPSNATLIFSYIGMKTQDVAVKGKTKIDVTLHDDAQALDEIVVIGYGTAKKKDLTGSVSSVSGETLAKIPVTNTAQALTGRLAGVQITTADGSPDAEMIIRVRGGGSVTGDNSPLYIVDGFPVSSINDIAPGDIQTIDVLKDASSTAIYGSQGANGVVIITTKSARGGKTQISYNGYMQGKTLKNKQDVLSPYEFALFNYEMAVINNEVDKFAEKYGVYDDLELYKHQEGIDWQDDMFGNTVLSQQHNVSISGGSDKTKFSLSTTYTKDGGLMVNNDYSRFNLNFKLSHQIAKNLKIDFGTRFSDTEANGSGSSGGTYKIRTYEAVSKAPVMQLGLLTDKDTSSMTDDELEQYRKDKMTLSEQAAQYWKRRNDRLLNLTAAVTWDIIKDLTYKLEGGYDYGFKETKNYWGPDTSQSSNEGQNLPLADWQKVNTSKYRIANTLNYKFTVADKHDFNILLGQEIISGGNNNNYMKAKYFSKSLDPEKIFANMGLNSGALGSTSVTSYVSPNENMASFFGRIGYNFNDRYLFNFTFRADGSSKFASGNQWGYFPAAAFAWRISEESFMDNTKNWLSNLKLRLSYGTAGNNRIASLLYKLDYKINTNKPYGVGETNNPYYTPTNTIMANPKLKWETTVTRNVGFDFGVLNERLTGTIDAYWNTTKDLLITSKVVAPGYTTQQRNVGQTSNKGVELSLNAYIIEKKNYSLSANFNIGLNRSKVDKLADGILEQEYNSGWAGTDLTGADDYRVIVGQPVGVIYGFVTDGYYTTSDFSEYSNGKYIIKTDGNGNPVAPTTSPATGKIGVRPGAIKFKDLNGDGKIDLSDRTVIGKTAPKHTGGFGLNGRVYGFDVSVMFSWVYGNKIYNANKIASSQQYRTNNPNLLEFMNSNNRYSYIDENGKQLTSLADLARYNEGDNAKEYWSPLSFGNANVVPHSWAIEDGSFLRLQNITVGYTLPQNWTQKFACSQLRLYCTLNNVFCWTNYTGYDPEVSSPVRSSSTSGLTPGVDYSSYPKSFSWTAGVNITF